MAPSVADTDWGHIVILYGALNALAPNPIVELNREVAVSIVTEPAAALALVDGLAESFGLRGSHLLPSVRDEQLARLGRAAEARTELLAASRLTSNEQQSAALQAKAATLA